MLALGQFARQQPAVVQQINRLFAAAKGRRADTLVGAERELAGARAEQRGQGNQAHDSAPPYCMLRASPAAMRRSELPTAWRTMLMLATSPTTKLWLTVID